MTAGIQELALVNKRKELHLTGGESGEMVELKDCQQEETEGSGNFTDA